VFVIILFTPFQNLKRLTIGSTVGLVFLLYLVIFSVPAVCSYLPPPSERAIALTRKESGKAHKSFLGKILGAGTGGGSLIF
jgi:predicted exporter